MSAFLVSQILVVGAVIGNLLSYQFRERKTVIVILAVAVALVAGHFYFLDQMAGFWATSFAVVYFLVSTQTTDKRLMWFFLLSTVAIIYYTYSSLIDLLILLSAIVTIVSLFINDQKVMRELQMFGSATRIIVYLIIFSPVGVALEVTLLSSNIIGYWRFYVRKQNLPSVEKEV